MNDKLNEIKRLEIILNYCQTLDVCIHDLAEMVIKERDNLKSEVTEYASEMSDKYKDDANERKVEE